VIYGHKKHRKTPLKPAKHSIVQQEYRAGVDGHRGTKTVPVLLARGLLTSIATVHTAGDAHNPKSVAPHLDWLTAVDTLIVPGAHAMLDDLAADTARLEASLEETLWVLEPHEVSQAITALPSMHEVWDLLMDAAWPLPFLSEHRAANRIRVHARAGLRYLLGFDDWNRVRTRCPLCDGVVPPPPPAAGGGVAAPQPHVTPPPLTVPHWHLFRDCPRLETKRREAVQAASDAAVGLSVPGSYAHEPMQRAMALQHHNNWYRLMMGSPSCGVRACSDPSVMGEACLASVLRRT
jgi:hypothetical protein